MKHLIALITTILIALSGISQDTTVNKTTAIPNYQLIEAIKDIEKGKILALEVKAKDNRIVLLEATIRNKDSIIALLKSKDSLFVLATKTYDASIKIFEAKSTIYENQIRTQQKEITTLRRKNNLAKWVQILLIGGLTYSLVN